MKKKQQAVYKGVPVSAGPLLPGGAYVVRVSHTHCVWCREFRRWLRRVVR